MKREVQYCAASRCRQIVQPGKLMCKGHWFSVPKGQRERVLFTWRAVQKGRGQASRSTFASIVAAYRDAVRAAIDAIDDYADRRADVRRTTAFAEDGSPISYEQGRLL